MGRISINEIVNYGKVEIKDVRTGKKKEYRPSSYCDGRESTEIFPVTVGEEKDQIKVTYRRYGEITEYFPKCSTIVTVQEFNVQLPFRGDKITEYHPNKRIMYYLLSRTKCNVRFRK